MLSPAEPNSAAPEWYLWCIWCCHHPNRDSRTSYQVFIGAQRSHNGLRGKGPWSNSNPCQGQGCYSLDRVIPGPIQVGCPTQKRWHWGHGSPAYPCSHGTLTAGMAQFGLFWMRTSHRCGLVRGISAHLTQLKNSCCETQKLQEQLQTDREQV